jgi:hypothetical protein
MDLVPSSVTGFISRSPWFQIPVVERSLSTLRNVLTGPGAHATSYSVGAGWRYALFWDFTNLHCIKSLQKKARIWFTP